MKNKNIIRFVNSLVFLPVMTMSLTLGGVQNTPFNSGVLKNSQDLQNLSAQEFDIVNQDSTPMLVLEEIATLKALKNQLKADLIDDYFKSRNMPLSGQGMKMIKEAEKNDLDWRLLPAIAVRESTGGKFACNRVKNNPFGWGSCKIGFESVEKAIETVAKNLGGNNPKTSHHYDEKTTLEILRTYNPPSIVPRYAEQVMNIMNTIGAEEVKTEL